ncbi:MAG: ACT domain-containing protein [Solirubrobacterales bacterium]
MSQFAVIAVGRDRPGIAAAIAAGLLEVDGNIEDSRMTNLGGHFAVMLLVSTPSADREAVAAVLAPIRADLGLEALTVAPVADAAAAAAPDHVITVYGADHPGIVHAVTSGLAADGVNVADLQTRIGGAAGDPIYMMVLEVELGDCDAGAVGDKLREIAGANEVEIDLRPLEAEAL